MKQILCFGDSNTWGFDPVTGGRYPWEVRWPGLLETKLQCRGVRVIEEGLCGRTAAFDDPGRDFRNGLATLPFILESNAGADAAVIMLGTNDCKTVYGAGPEQIAAGIGKCTETLLKAFSRENVLIVSPILLGENVWMPGYEGTYGKESVQTSKGLAAAIRTVAEKLNVRMIDASLFAGPSETDLQHLSPAGHAAMAEAVFRAISEMPALRTADR